MLRSTNQEERELLRCSNFAEQYTPEIPVGWFGLYTANPKNRWKRFKDNDEFANWLFETHALTFINSKTVRYGEFYIFQVNPSMKNWALGKLEELERTNLGVHFQESKVRECSWIDY